MYTHQSGDSVTLGGAGNGEVYDFDEVNSTRARSGARLSKENCERGTYYVGLAYEYEFDGEAKATVKGLSTPAPSIKGSSGMLELGYIIQNKDVNALLSTLACGAGAAKSRASAVVSILSGSFD